MHEPITRRRSVGYRHSFDNNINRISYSAIANNDIWCAVSNGKQHQILSKITYEDEKSPWVVLKAQLLGPYPSPILKAVAVGVRK